MKKTGSFYSGYSNTSGGKIALRRKPSNYYLKYKEKKIAIKKEHPPDKKPIYEKASPTSGKRIITELVEEKPPRFQAITMPPPDRSCFNAEKLKTVNIKMPASQITTYKPPPENTEEQKQKLKEAKLVNAEKERTRITSREAVKNLLKRRLELNQLK